MQKKFLTPKQRKFVAFWNGNQTESARLAGYANPEVNGNVLMQKPHVRAAIEEKDRAFLQRVGRREAEGVTITRNGIINGLAEIAQDIKMASASRVSAYGHLKDIFGLTARNDRDTDIFAGWSKEELGQYARTGELPERFGSGVSSSEGASPSGQPRTN